MRIAEKLFVLKLCFFGICRHDFGGFQLSNSFGTHANRSENVHESISSIHQSSL